MSLKPEELPVLALRSFSAEEQSAWRRRRVNRVKVSPLINRGRVSGVKRNRWTDQRVISRRLYAPPRWTAVEMAEFTGSKKGRRLCRANGSGKMTARHCRASKDARVRLGVRRSPVSAAQQRPVRRVSGRSPASACHVPPLAARQPNKLPMFLISRDSY